MNEKTVIFTDGSSRGNPGAGGWGAIIAESVSGAEHVREIGGGEKMTTNNRMELLALVSALQIAKGSDIVVHTDSAYLISGITEWISGWKKNNWKTKTKADVLNRDLWEALDRVCSGKQVEYKKIKGHAGVPANERCDQIATAFADGKNVDLYTGPIEAYTIDLERIKGTDNTSKKSSSKNTAAAYSYVVCLNGTIDTFKTWEECKAKVNKVSGVKFKKSVSLEDEKEIIKQFLRL